MQVIWDQITRLVGAYIPNLIGALAILIVGWLVALIVSAIVRGVLRRTTLDNRLARWIMGEKAAEGVEVERQIARGVYYLIIGPAYRPQKRSITERSHQTWDGQVLAGQTFAAWEQLRWALERRRKFMNEHLPCASLGGKPPLVAYPQARIPRRVYRPEWEVELMNLDRVYAYLAQGRWFRKGSNVGAFCLGHQRYILGKDWIGKDAEIVFDPRDQHLVFRSPEVDNAKRLPIKGITKTKLMGEMGPLVGLDHFQLALPFTWDEWRVSRLSETLVSRLYGT